MPRASPHPALMSLLDLLLLPHSSLPYDTAKQSFHSSNAGLPLYQLYLVSLPALSSLVLYWSYRSRPPNGARRFIHEFVVLVLPLILGMTLCAGRPLVLNAVLLMRASAVWWNERRAEALHEHLASADDGSQQTHKDTDGERPPAPADAKAAYHYPPLTTYRAHMMLMTVLSILACDFPVFPRALGKTSIKGWSLMDVGVGSFVLSSGLAAARSLVPRPGGKGGAGVGKTLRRQLPLLALALARVVAVKALHYPEQVEEYGVHWNFFCTLFLLPLLALTFKPLLRAAARTGGAEWAAGVATSLGLAVTAVHQGWLDGGVGPWALGEDRSGMLAQNKEGIVSLPGYLAIYLFGSAIGLLLPLSPPSPPTKEPAPGVVLAQLAPLLAVLGAAFAAARYYAVGGGPSRRLANTQYVLHTAVYNLFFLSAYILLDAFYFTSRPALASSSPAPASSRAPPPSTPASRAQAPGPRTPTLFHSLNAHPLALFLLANLLTGLVNLALPTMYVRDVPALVVLGAYAGVVCAVGWGWP
ncbi:GWT1-domain-containing protein [Calocera viscosa TUFC12733]|uniref:GPI-anchored wall transfer protein n=1 Tax=Calocera viscosa (strain TUFC12733) TaxID=1330018 RepID=A0A167KJD5_CALVF|nr:GWT1-domain-containing protein [Calocera viscosa TUFC12733]